MIQLYFDSYKSSTSPYIYVYIYIFVYIYIYINQNRKQKVVHDTQKCLTSPKKWHNI